MDGPLKDAVLKIEGKGVFGEMRWERGVHRVQRVPETEGGGRVHTSTIGVVVSLLILLFLFGRFLLRIQRLACVCVCDHGKFGSIGLFAEKRGWEGGEMDRKS